MTENIEWTDPPKSTVGRRTSSKYARIAAELRTNPGRWAVIHDAPNHLANSVRSGRTAAFQPAGAFDATARRLDDGTIDCYVKFIDPEGTDSE